MNDKILQSIAKRSLTYGPRARQLLKERTSGLIEDTRVLTDLTRRLEAENDSIRPLLADDQQQPEMNEQDAVLEELRRMFG